MNETIPCIFCGDETLLMGTQECDNCHKIRTRISKSGPQVTMKIVKEVFKLKDFVTENRGKKYLTHEDVTPIHWRKTNG